MNSYDFEGRVALVTGGARGIGAAAIAALKAGGARCASFDLSDSEDGDVLSLNGDVTESGDLAAAVERVESELGSLDILVCCAGIAGESLPVPEITDEEWQKVIGINLTGTFYANRAVLPGMISRGYGRIVNIASIAGKDGSFRSSAYSASKAGVISISKSIGKEVAKTGVIVNAITPAVIHTPILDGVPQEEIDFMAGRIPIGRVGQPEEVARMVAFVASQDNSFTTGAVFDLSGGTATY